MYFFCFSPPTLLNLWVKSIGLELRASLVSPVDSILDNIQYCKCNGYISTKKTMLFSFHNKGRYCLIEKQELAFYLWIRGFMYPVQHAHAFTCILIGSIPFCIIINNNL